MIVKASAYQNNFGSVQLVPSALVGPVQAFLAAQGYDQGLVQSDGSVDPAALLPFFFDTIEVHTAIADTFTINLKGPPDPSTAEMMKQIQPALVFRGPVGQATIAPFGMPSGIVAVMKSAPMAIGLGVGAALLGLMLIGRAL